ncbi:MAG TPA: tetratricopeptide repeat protein [Xanthomonadaceae bacterium]|nr:tetratricopeptide repeat protein [Xanthomonadaceae bacterium]
MSRFLLALFMVALALGVRGESLLKPLPQPDLSHLPAEVADALRQQRADFDEARSTLVGPPLAAAFGLMGGLYARNGLFEPAQVALDNAVALTPEDFRMVYLSGLVAIAAQDLPKARERMEQAQALQPDYPATRIHLAGVLARLGATEAAARMYGEAIAADANAATAHVRLGQLAMDRQQFGQAVAHFNDALKADPEADSIYYQLAAAERARGNEAEARAAEARAGRGPLTLADPLGRALFGPPEDPLDGVLNLIAEGKLEQARATLGEYLEIEPDNARLLALLARVEAGLGNFAAAREAAQRSMREAPEAAAAVVAAGVVEEMAGAEARATELYTRAVALDGGEAEARLMLADALMRARRFAEAADHYRAVAALDGERAIGLPRLVAAEVLAGRCGTALADAGAAREKHPRDGVRAEIFVRVAASCASASDEDRALAVQLANAIYQAAPDAHSSEAAAMAAAAVGQWEDAQDLQRQALFELAKRDQRAAIERSRALLDRFVAEQKAELPWPAGHPLYAPTRMQPPAR